MTVLEAAKAAGYTTAAISWPVTADIDVDGICRKPGPPRVRLRRCMTNSSAAAQSRNFWTSSGRITVALFNGLYDPQFSLLAHGATLAAIRNHQPDVLFEHLSMVDHTRHSFGVLPRRSTRMPIWKLS